jgi:hypothetical protein
MSINKEEIKKQLVLLESRAREAAEKYRAEFTDIANEAVILRARLKNGNDFNED